MLLIASGAMSHTFWSLRELRAHEASDPAHIRTAAARAADPERIGWLEAGDHARVIETMPEFLKVRPEARFAHYLMMIAALGEGAVTAPGRAFSDYENSVGTGQMHLWFDRPAAGWRDMTEYRRILLDGGASRPSATGKTWSRGRPPGRCRGRGAPAAGDPDQDHRGAPQPPQPGHRVRRQAARGADVLPQAGLRARRARRRGDPAGQAASTSTTRARWPS